eukprot:CAMPEP_0185723466 /NCGR_PEP_ID=MMETSP1171-20130828/305_1 /TAXON_ID=374046 /ORGANISM="Helicotheca tamensis, Strain CCMP826" /LENGTH=220 /DNA_ID=CAMNT_0028391171 /DNA_START=81 /DNA_END=743 /DNA_ORIENTATION=-
MIRLQPAENETFAFAAASARAGPKYAPQHEEVSTPHKAHIPASHNIPMPRTHIHRTRSELQLREDMAAAEWRDFCMFHRLVNGMRERQQAHFAAQQRHAQLEGYGDCTVQADPIHAGQSKKNAFCEGYGCQMHGRTDAIALHDLRRVDHQHSGSTVAPNSQAHHTELQDVLHMASGDQYAAVDSDWSITGYDAVCGGYLSPHVIAPDDEEGECEIFSLDM